jgi:DnaJ-class molecular chaperone
LYPFTSKDLLVYEKGKSMLYYLTIKKKRRGSLMKRKTTASETKSCEYCSGKGYFQLILGGSETCPCCDGTGKNKTA